MTDYIKEMAVKCNEVHHFADFTSLGFYFFKSLNVSFFFFQIHLDKFSILCFVKLDFNLVTPSLTSPLLFSTLYCFKYLLITLLLVESLESRSLISFYFVLIFLLFPLSIFLFSKVLFSLFLR